MINADEAEAEQLAMLPEEELTWKMIPVWVKCDEEAEETSNVQARGRPRKRKHHELDSSQQPEKDEVDYANEEGSYSFA